MYGLGLSPEGSHRKCARVVGEVLGKYHPHGGSIVSRPGHWITLSKCVLRAVCNLMSLAIYVVVNTVCSRLSDSAVLVQNVDVSVSWHVCNAIFHMLGEPGSLWETNGQEQNHGIIELIVSMSKCEKWGASYSTDRMYVLLSTVQLGRNRSLVSPGVRVLFVSAMLLCVGDMMVPNVMLMLPVSDAAIGAYKRQSGI